jgi:hypothetical protein
MKKLLVPNQKRLILKSSTSPTETRPMFTVTYTFYRKYQHTKTFDTYEAAKKFFWVIQKARGVTSTKLD